MMLLNGSLNFGAQMVTNGGDWRRTDMVGLGTSTLFGFAAGATIGSLMTWRPFEHSESERFSILGYHRTLSQYGTNLVTGLAFGGMSYGTGKLFTPILSKCTANEIKLLNNFYKFPIFMTGEATNAVIQKKLVNKQ